MDNKFVVLITLRGKANMKWSDEKIEIIFVKVAMLVVIKSNA